MRDAWCKVLAFHKAMGLPVGDLADPRLSRVKLRIKMIKDALEELELAIEANDMPEIADALSDLDYVIIGAGVEWGIYLPDVFDEVHRANMRKVGGPKDDLGKQLKPPGWKPPDIEGVLERQVLMEKNVRRYRELCELAEFDDE